MEVNPATYVHFVVGQTWQKKEDAVTHMEAIQKVIDVLAKEYKVYLRRAPSFCQERDFENDYYEWKTSARFSVIPDTVVGIDNPRTYDNDNMITGFGLIDNNRSK